MYRYATTIIRDDEELDESYQVNNFDEVYKYLKDAYRDEWEIVLIVRKEELKSV